MSEARLKEDRVQALVDFITAEEDEEEKPKKKSKKAKIAAVDDERFSEMFNDPDFKVDDKEKQKRREERKERRQEKFSNHEEEDDDIGIYGIESTQTLNYDNSNILDFGSKSKEERNMSFKQRLEKKDNDQFGDDSKKRKRQRGATKKSKHVKRY